MKKRIMATINHCWRGGQRSKSFAIILSEVGLRTYQLDGGYIKNIETMLSII